MQCNNSPDLNPSTMTNSLAFVIVIAEYRPYSQDRRPVYALATAGGGTGGAALFFQPDLNPAIAAIVPNNPTQPSEISPLVQDQ